MKTIFLVIFACLAVIATKAQNTYIQVNGEPGLSVYINDQFKCRTTAELNGCIIENITPGNNRIKVVKEGYTPYEETVTVKKGEVFAYKVKPFSKAVVKISEEGNSGETDTQTKPKTGKLVIQSVPIEIKITIPRIEGVNNSLKQKDQWIASDIPQGEYEIIFRFGDKEITKTIDIKGDHTTSIFANMLNGQVTTTTTIYESVANQQKLEKRRRYVDSIFNKYKFKPGLTSYQFFRYCPEAQSLWSGGQSTGSGGYYVEYKNLKKNKYAVPAYTEVYMSYNSDKVLSATYTLDFTTDHARAQALFERVAENMKQNSGWQNCGIVNGKQQCSVRTDIGNVELILWRRDEHSQVDLKFYGG